MRLTIRHEEASVRTDFAADQAAASGILATTRVTLTRAGDAAPIWSDEFTLPRARRHARRRPACSSASEPRRYWASFFVPVATWDTSAAVRAARGLEKPVASVAVSEARAIVLFTDGDLEMYHLGDPQQPVPLGAYRHKRDLSRWSGLHVAGDRIVLFGPDGIEVLALRRRTLRAGARARPRRRSARSSPSRAWAAIWWPRAIADCVAARGGQGPARAAARAPGARASRALGDRLLFTDGTSLFVSTASLLRERRVEAELRLGRGFGPGPLRVDDRQVIVIAQRGVAVVDLSAPSAPRLHSRIETTEAGEIRDAARVGGPAVPAGRAGPSAHGRAGSRVVDSACVVARLRVAPAGRHLVMIGEKALQVVDATPFVARARLAARRRCSPDPRGVPRQFSSVSQRVGTPSRTTITSGPFE